MYRVLDEFTKLDSNNVSNYVPITKNKNNEINNKADLIGIYTHFDISSVLNELEKDKK